MNVEQAILSRIQTLKDDLKDIASELMATLQSGRDVSVNYSVIYIRNCIECKRLLEKEIQELNDKLEDLYCSKGANRWNDAIYKV